MENSIVTATKLNTDVMLILPPGCMVNQLNLYVLQLKHPYAKMAKKCDSRCQKCYIEMTSNLSFQRDFAN